MVRIAWLVFNITIMGGGKDQVHDQGQCYDIQGRLRVRFSVLVNIKELIQIDFH